MKISHSYCYSSYSQINWQIYPPSQLSTDDLSNVTQNLADLPPSIQHRCLEYCYTKLGRSTGRSTPQSSIDALTTITPNLADQLADPPPIKHRCLEYHYTKLCRSTPHQSSTDDLSTITPNLADLPPQLSIDALSTVTPNLADLLADLAPHQA